MSELRIFFHRRGNHGTGQEKVGSTRIKEDKCHRGREEKAGKRETDTVLTDTRSTCRHTRRGVQGKDATSACGVDEATHVTYATFRTRLEGAMIFHNSAPSPSFLETFHNVANFDPSSVDLRGDHPVWHPPREPGTLSAAANASSQTKAFTRDNGFACQKGLTRYAACSVVANSVNTLDTSPNRGEARRT